MARTPKSEEIKVRVSADIKSRIVELATARGESESVVVREALLQYLDRHSVRAAGLRRAFSGEYPEPDTKLPDVAERGPDKP